MFGKLSSTIKEDGSLGTDHDTMWDGTVPISRLQQPVVYTKPVKVNTWTDRRIKKASDAWEANRRFEEETGGYTDPIFGWTDAQIQFAN